MDFLTRLEVKNSGWFLFLVATIYTIVAYYSSGYHHWDEHYQLIEFANYKLGGAKISDLAWEFDAKIRPTLQPTICFLILKRLKLAGLSDPYQQAFVLRLITASLSIFVIHFFIRSSKKLITKQFLSIFILLSYLLWFLPYINVRFASESWSGMLFMIAAALILSEKYKESNLHLIWIGLSMGIAVLFRYQSAILVVGAFAWLTLIARLQILRLAVILTSVVIVLFAGFLIDIWFYGEYTFSLYRYFEVNLIQGKSSEFGTSPWYTILEYILLAPGIFGVMMVAATLFLWLQTPKNLILWCVTPFLLIHMIIPHKELRFLFPLANFAPIILVLFFQELDQFYKLKYSYLPITLAVFSFIYNTLALITIGSTGAGKGKIAIAQQIHYKYGNMPINLISTSGLNPYTDWRTRPNNTFYPIETSFSPINSIWQEDFILQKKEGYLNLVLLSQSDITGPRALAYFKQLNLVEIFQSHPSYLQWLYPFYSGQINSKFMILYEFK